MTDEIKRHRITVMVTVFAVLFLVLLVSALVSNLVRLAALKNRQETLQAQLVQIDEAIKNNEEQITFQSSDEYVDMYAREHLGLVGKGEKPFIAK